MTTITVDMMCLDDNHYIGGIVAYYDGQKMPVFLPGTAGKKRAYLYLSNNKMKLFSRYLNSKNYKMEDVKFVVTGTNSAGGEAFYKVDNPGFLCESKLAVCSI
jgi:hypothetical protein